MINILLNYDSDINLVQDEFGIQFAKVEEMIPGCYLFAIQNEDDFDQIQDFMELNGKLEVIGMFNFLGKQFGSKLDKNKYTKEKYLKYLEDKWIYDLDGNKIEKLPKDFWQVTNYMGWNTRDL